MGAPHWLFLTLLSSCLAAPLEDTEEVREARAQFLAAFDEAKEGKHAALAPVNNDIQAPQIANAYLDDTEAVVEAKADHKVAFDTAAAGGLAHMQAEPVAAFYIAKTDEVAEAEKKFMEEFAINENGEHVKFATVNNDVQAPQIANMYIADTPEVVDAKDQFMTYFAEAKLKSEMPVEASVETAPVVVAVKSAAPAAAVNAIPAAPVKVAPTIYNLPMVHGYPTLAFPLPLNYFILPVAPSAPAAPAAPAEEAAVVEEA